MFSSCALLLLTELKILNECCLFKLELSTLNKNIFTKG